MYQTDLFSTLTSLRPVSNPATPEPIVSPIKKLKISLKFYGAYSKRQPLLQNYNVTDLCVEKDIRPMADRNDGSPVFMTLVSRYSYFYFIGTAAEWDEFFDIIFGHEDDFKVIGIRDVDMVTNEPIPIPGSVW